MNHFDGRAERRGDNWYAMLRLAGDGELKPLLNKRGSPIAFVDEIAAMRAVLAHTFAYFNGHLVRDGEFAGAGERAGARAAAQLLFRKGKAIKVERSRARRAARP
ncbi:UNVERIFIED_ORG: hypothetical protein LHK14_17795 [Roseateles sp. XES5]|nr:hypothetical protein [Roseateles sp. XES5]